MYFSFIFSECITITSSQEPLNVCEHNFFQEIWMESSVICNLPVQSRFAFIKPKVSLLLLAYNYGDSFFWHLVMDDISFHCLFCYYLLLFLFFIIKQWLQRVFGCLIINWLAQNSVRIHALPPPPPPSKNKKTKKTGICNKY